MNYEEASISDVSHIWNLLSLVYKQMESMNTVLLEIY